MEKKILTVDDIMAAIMKNSEKKEETPDYLLEDVAWAQNSKFYNQVMADGYIFNPYLHRRFLPAQFLKLIKDRGLDVRSTIGSDYGIMYSIKWTIQEVGKLAFLQDVDQIAFKERKKFLTLEDVKKIVEDYTSSVMIYAERSSYETSSGRRCYIPNRRHMQLTELQNELEDFCRKVKQATSYKGIEKILNDFRLIKLEYAANKSDAFIEVFMKSGAYYTLKHLVLFENLTLKGKSGAEAADLLKNYIDKSADEVYGVLKDVIAENKYAF